MGNATHDEWTDLDKSIVGIGVTPEVIVINSDPMRCELMIDRGAQSRGGNDL